MELKVWTLFVVLFCAALAIARPTQAQITPSPSEIFGPLASEKRVSETINQKRANGAPILIGPIDSVGLANLQTSGGDPCDIAVPIAFGQSINAELSSTDCRLEDMSYADFYIFDGLQGEQIVINMGSGVIDSYLGVANQSGTWVIEDDDGGGATNARIVATLPESGTFIILANSALPNQLGNYTLSLSGGPTCTFTFTPGSADIPPEGGTFSFNVTTGPRCYWAAGSGEYWATTSSSGLGSGTVTYTAQANPINQIRSVNIIIRNTYFWVRQAAKVCDYSLSPSSVNVGAFTSSGSFSVSAPQGCFWSASAEGYFLSASGWANGSGTVNYTASHFNGVQRSGVIRVRDTTATSTTGRNFTVNQTGLNCTYSVGPIVHDAPATGYTGTVSINTQSGCTWYLYNASGWIQTQASGAGSGPATIQISVPPRLQRSPTSGGFFISWSVSENSQSQTIYVNQQGRLAATAADFDGDFMTDISVYRPSSGEWWTLPSQNNATRGAQFGTAGDIIAPGDYTGDGKTDLAFFRPSNGNWYVVRSENSSFYAFPFGGAGDIPVPADFDGDGKVDPAVFRSTEGVWYVLRSTTGSVVAAQFGASGDLPLAADYDGDAKADFAIYRNGEWWIQRSTGGVNAVRFGTSTDIPVLGDFTGDGKADIAFFRTASGYWYVLRSENSTYYAFPFGSGGDVPAVGEYDGDGVSDAAVFRPSNGTWYIRRSYNGFIKTAVFGLNGDMPVPTYSGR